ncbi:MAG TPA: sigma-54 dependent transcriptional regulator [Candidatus Binatia bacterium]|jgi:DNA-binding NtrC family response regulator|nr:sigma-54 dependent transcriptional regulator [Candidatus Binatia bacterium]
MDAMQAGVVGMDTVGRTTTAAVAEAPAFPGIVGRHASMQAIFDIIRRVAPTDATVLITGESGTGKELVAAALHRMSRRAPARFVPVHCGAIPEDLLESEMFGHERGAFTGAIASRVGRFKLADGGTIFLDEIGEMSPKLQVKLLRVLEDGRFEPVGSVVTQQVDVRIIAATNRTLEQAVANRQFREDLFYRLRVVPIEMPPLRRRREDIPLLVEHILTGLVAKGLPRYEVDPGAMEVLQRYNWPGNVRELRNLLEQMVVLGRPEGIIAVRDLPPHLLTPRELSGGATSMPWQFGPGGIDFYREMEAIEDRIIAQALRLSGGNKKEAARLLRVNRTTLLEKLKRKRAQGSPLMALLGGPVISETTNIDDEVPCLLPQPARDVPSLFDPIGI